MNAKKVIGWAVVIFLAWYLITNPTGRSRRRCTNLLNALKGVGNSRGHVLQLAVTSEAAGHAADLRGNNPPREVNKYLLLHEQQVITVRMHPAVLMAPSGDHAGGLIVAVVLQRHHAEGPADPGVPGLDRLGGPAAAGWSGRHSAGRLTTSWSPRSG